MHVVMTCTAQEVGSLSWFQNGISSQDQTYLYESNDSYPIPLYNRSGIVIEIVNAIPETSQSDTFDANSTLSADILSLREWNVQSIRCGTNAVRSQTVNLTTTDILRMLYVCIVFNDLPMFTYIVLSL